MHTQPPLVYSFRTGVRGSFPEERSVDKFRSGTPGRIRGTLGTIRTRSVPLSFAIRNSGRFLPTKHTAKPGQKSYLRCTPGRIRTFGQRLRRPLLCPLSYGRELDGSYDPSSSYEFASHTLTSPTARSSLSCELMLGCCRWSLTLCRTSLADRPGVCAVRKP